MRHYLGAALLEAGDAEEAERVHRRDTELNRNDGWALFGLWQSLQAQDKAAEADEVFGVYEQAWQHADGRTHAFALLIRRLSRECPRTSMEQPRRLRASSLRVSAANPAAIITGARANRTRRR